MAWTLAELLTLPTQQEVLDQEVLPELRLRSVRVTDWKPSGVYNAMALVVSKLRASFRAIGAAIAASQFPDYAFGLIDPPNGIDVTGWCDLVGKYFYGEDRIEATYTKRTILLTNSSATPYTVIAGNITIEFTATRNRYVLDQGGTIPALGSVSLTFRSEFPNDSTGGLQYNDASGATIILVTARYSGVTATNPATTYSSVATTSSALGTVTPGGSPTGSHTVAVRFDTSGNTGVALWSTSLDGGAFVSQGAASSITNLGGFGINITLANNGGNPAFEAGAFYYFSTPGSDITQAGRDIESPQEYGLRCKAKIALFSVSLDANGNAVPISPSETGYALLAKKASTQVKYAFVTIGTVNNEVRVYVLGQGVLLSSPTLAAIQTYLRSFTMLTDRPVALSPAQSAITLGGGAITVRAAYLTTAQQSLQRALALYFSGVDPAKRFVGVNPRLDHEYISALITMTAGVSNFTDTTLTLNGVIGDLQLPITPGAYEIPSWSQDVATAFTWLTTED